MHDRRTRRRTHIAVAVGGDGNVSRDGQPAPVRRRIVPRGSLRSRSGGGRPSASRIAYPRPSGIDLDGSRQPPANRGEPKFERLALARSTTGRLERDHPPRAEPPRRLHGPSGRRSRGAALQRVERNVVQADLDGGCAEACLRRCPSRRSSRAAVRRSTREPTCDPRHDRLRASRPTVVGTRLVVVEVDVQVGVPVVALQLDVAAGDAAVGVADRAYGRRSSWRGPGARLG